MNSNIEHLIAVSKPASMPIHPSGAYNFNTLISILTHENYAKTYSKDFRNKDLRNRLQPLPETDKTSNLHIDNNTNTSNSTTDSWLSIGTPFLIHRLDKVILR